MAALLSDRAEVERRAAIKMIASETASFSDPAILKGGRSQLRSISWSNALLCVIFEKRLIGAITGPNREMDQSAGKLFDSIDGLFRSLSIAKR
jgi:hypothetical protein